MNLCDFLEENKIEFKLDESLSNQTNFRIGGKAKVVCFPSKISSLVRLLKYLSQTHTKFFVIGNGTNLLCSDYGYDGLVVKLSKLKGYRVENNLLWANAGINLFELNKIALEHELSGLEFSYGIPASVGGAVSMNAGAFGQSMADIIKYVKVFDGKKIVTIQNQDLDLQYRHSVIQERDWVVLGAMFELKKSVAENIKNAMEKNLDYRKQTQPYGFASAGSVFKRLSGGEIPVSKMIDQSGLKGKTIGGASVSTIHAGFIVNNGKATCKDVLNLIKYIVRKLETGFGVSPELEIKLLGENDGITW